MTSQMPFRNKKWIKYSLTVLAAAALAALCVITARTPSTAGEGHIPLGYESALSLLPPFIAIALALLTKEVYFSLFMGILAGGLLYAHGNLELTLNTILYNEDGGFIPNIASVQNASILVFVVLLGSLVAMMNKAGGSAAFGRWVSGRIKTRVGVQLATILLGILIFVDDGFNCMTVGSVIRPVTDRHRISRAKLAYLIDATAAPICIIAPISSWAAAVTYSVPADSGINGFEMFLRTIPYNFYALGTIVMMLLIVTLKLDYGPMRLHEENAMRGDLFTTPDRPYQDADDAVPSSLGRVTDLVLPVVVLICSCIIGIVYTGGFFDGVGFIDAFANSNSAMGLVFGSLVAVIFTFFLYMCRGVISFGDFMECFPAGFRSMCAPMIILVMAWNLSGMTGLLGADAYIHDLTAATAGEIKIFLPCIIFVIAVFLAFSTGTSWGTFSILIPIVCSVFAGSDEMLTISIAACLSGAVCGDHCSPISDTTIMASAGAHSNHVNHVVTQMPYAFTCAGVCAVGYLIAGLMGYSMGNARALLSLPITLLLLAAVLFAASGLSKRRRAGKG